MISIEIPGYPILHIEHVVMDVNGTLAVDGNLIADVVPLLAQLRTQVRLHMLTADTHGRQAEIDAQLGFKARIVERGSAEKAEYVRKLGAQGVIAIGNGMNDRDMCQAAALSIAVLGEEGVAAALIGSADVLVRDIRDAFGLLLNPQRLRATLRR